MYGDNRIAGIPIHIYEAELLYQAANGFYAGPNLRCNLSNYPVDEANSLFADPYALFGFRVGYRSKKGLSVFFEAKNLTDERFASAVDAIADARIGDESPEVFIQATAALSTAESGGVGELCPGSAINRSKSSSCL